VTIYFAASIAGGRHYLETYRKIVDHLQQAGHTIPTVHIVHPQVLEVEKGLTPEQIYTRDVEWIEGSDCMIAEVSNPSLGVGYEIGYALNLDMPVLCLYHKDVFLSRMILGNTAPGLTVRSYESDEEWQAIVEEFLHGIRQSEH